MKNFDKQEQDIHDAFSSIQVDTENLKNKLNFSTTHTPKKIIKLPAIAAAILIFAILSITAYATISQLEFFRTEFNPVFIDLVSPPSEPIYSENNGIRMEIIGASQIYNRTLIYVTVQDISGESRLNNGTHPDFYIIGFLGSHSRLLYFNQETDTSYFEILLIRCGELASNEIIVRSHGIRGLSSSNSQQQLVTDDAWQMNVTIPQVIYPFSSFTDIVVSNLHIDRLTILPVGLHISGTHTGIFELNVKLEIGSTLIPMVSGGGMIGDDRTFYFDWTSSELIDVESVTAIIINGYRIEVPE